MRSHGRTARFDFLGCPCRIVPLLLTCAIPGCAADDGSGDGWAGTVRDSAGVAIVENPAEGLWTPDDRWTIREDLRIGRITGAPEYQLGRITDIAVDSAGRIYVLDSQAQVVRVFGRNGAFQHTIGSPGEGPGELTDRASAVLLGAGDTMYVVDGGTRRVQRFLVNGRPAGSFSLPALMQGTTGGWVATASGTLVHRAQAISFSAVSSGEPLPPSVIVERSAAGTIIDTLFVLPRGETMRPGGGIRVFGAEPIWALLDDGRLVTAITSDYRLEVRGAATTLAHIITRPYEATSVTEADREAIRSRMRETFREQAERTGQAEIASRLIEAIFADLSFADTYPLFTRMIGGPDASIWVQRTRSIGNIGPSAFQGRLVELGAPRWDVFASNGRFLGTVTLPDRFRLIAIRNGAIYGVWRDELDVQYVLRLDIVRPGADSASAAAASPA